MEHKEEYKKDEVCMRVEDEIILTTIQRELIRAIKTLDYAYFEDLGGLEYNINFKINVEGLNPLLLGKPYSLLSLSKLLNSK